MRFFGIIDLADLLGRSDGYAGIGNLRSQVDIGLFLIDNVRFPFDRVAAPLLQAQPNLRPNFARRQRLD